MIIRFKGITLNWHHYKTNNIVETSPALETLIVTQAWLKGITARLQEQFSQNASSKFIDAVKECVVSYPTVHHMEHFQSHYGEAVSYIESLGFSLGGEKDVLVLWLPSENGYCQCAFVCYVEGREKPVIISPEQLPVVD